ncbi:MAG: hypothetical protein ABI448_12990 [Bacteroidia bacterium]
MTKARAASKKHDKLRYEPAGQHSFCVMPLKGNTKANAILVWREFLPAQAKEHRFTYSQSIILLTIKNFYFFNRTFK